MQNDVLSVWTTVSNPNDSVNVVINFAPNASINILTVSNHNVLVVLPFTEIFEVRNVHLYIEFVLNLLLIGTQPENGTMKFIRTKHHLPGYEKSNGTIQITYFFPSGIQDVYLIEIKIDQNVSRCSFDLG